MNTFTTLIAHLDITFCEVSKSFAPFSIGFSVFFFLVYKSALHILMWTHLKISPRPWALLISIFSKILWHKIGQKGTIRPWALGWASPLGNASLPPYHSLLSIERGSILKGKIWTTLRKVSGSRWASSCWTVYGQLSIEGSYPTVISQLFSLDHTDTAPVMEMVFVHSFIQQIFIKHLLSTWDTSVNKTKISVSKGTKIHINIISS